MLAAARAAAASEFAPSPKGKVVVLTGATGEIGTAIAQGLNLANNLAPTVGHLIIISRREGRGERVAQRLRNRSLRVSVVEADLSKRSAVDACVQQISALTPTVDVFIHAAAEVTRTHTLTEGDLEVQFATNCLSSFMLMTRLLPLFSARGRVVLLSDAKLSGGLDLADLQSARGDYNAADVYAKSKQALRMLAAEAAEPGRGFAEAGVSVTACHPGLVASPLSAALGIGSSVTTDSTATAGKTPLFLALGPAPGGVGKMWITVSGSFWVNKQQTRCAHAADREARRALWDACAELAAASAPQPAGVVAVAADNP